MRAQPQPEPDVSYDEAIARARAYIGAVAPDHCEHAATSLAIVALLNAQFEALADRAASDVIVADDVENMLLHVSAALQAVSRSISNIADAVAKTPEARRELGLAMSMTFGQHLAEALRRSDDAPPFPLKH
jgi:hypothetical protein